MGSIKSELSTFWEEKKVLELKAERAYKEFVARYFDWVNAQRGTIDKTNTWDAYCIARDKYLHAHSAAVRFRIN